MAAQPPSAPIQVAPNQGKLLQLLAQLQGAQTILEIGSLGGYSTPAVPGLPADGRLITLEVGPQHAAVTRPISPMRAWPMS